MRLVTLFALALALTNDRDSELSELRERARVIVQQNQSLEITTAEARRKIHFLVKDFKAWAERFDVELEARNRTYATPAKEIDEPLRTDRCPLFFEDELDQLCPLDLSRSEVWGATVVHCRYLCE